MKNSKIATACMLGNSRVTGLWKANAEDLLAKLLENRDHGHIEHLLQQTLPWVFINPPNNDKSYIPPYVIVRDTIYCAGITCENSLTHVARCVQKQLFSEGDFPREEFGKLPESVNANFRAACLAGIFKLLDFVMDNEGDFLEVNVRDFNTQIADILNVVVISDRSFKDKRNEIPDKHPFRGDAANYIPKFVRFKLNGGVARRIIEGFLNVWHSRSFYTHFPHFNQSASEVIISGLSEGVYRGLPLFDRLKLVSPKA